MRKPRENGWRDPFGVTHHICTRRVNSYHPTTRTATCGASLTVATRARFDAVDCMTCIIRVARRTRLMPRKTPNRATPSWWTKGGDRHVLSQNNPWRAVCGASLRTAYGSGNPPNCVPCGGKPDSMPQTISLQGPDGIRHALRPDMLRFERHAPCGAGFMMGIEVVKKPPNCPDCRAAITKAQRAQERKSRGRLPQRR